MRELLLLLVLFISTVSTAQNITDNKVSFPYTQLPLNPLGDQTSDYHVVVEDLLEKAELDSLREYNARFEAARLEYESELKVWNDTKKVQQREYLKKMITWKKATDKGETVEEPAKPIFPPQPTMKEVKKPRKSPPVDENQVLNSITLAGYDKGSGGAKISIGILPASRVNVISNTIGSGSSGTKYQYFAYYYLPISVKVTDPTEGIVWEETILTQKQSHKVGTYSSTYEFELWWLDNEEKFYSEFEEGARKRALDKASKIITDHCGLPEYTHNTEIYTVKKHKDHQYADLINAYTAAVQGFSLVSQELDHSAAEAKLTEAISAWETALSESNASDKNSRINERITSLLQSNLATAYTWLNEFDKGEMYLNLASNSGVKKFKRHAKRLKEVLDNNRERYNANN